MREFLRMSRKVFASLFLYYVAANIGCAVAQSDAPETWTYWVSGGKKGISPRVYRDDEFAIDVSEGFVNERALGFKENGGIIFLRSGKDIENPEFADPEMEEIGAVHDHKLWKAEYYRDEEAHKNVKAILLLIADDDDQLHPFFFIAVTNNEKLSVAVEPNPEQTKSVRVVSAPEKGTSHRFAFTFPKGVPRLMGDNKR
jgi:hypothetical protein